MVLFITVCVIIDTITILFCEVDYSRPWMCYFMFTLFAHFSYSYDSEIPVIIGLQHAVIGYIALL